MVGTVVVRWVGGEAGRGRVGEQGVGAESWGTSPRGRAIESLQRSAADLLATVPRPVVQDSPDSV